VTGPGGKFDTLDIGTRVPAEDLEGVAGERSDRQTGAARRLRSTDPSRHNLSVEVDGKFFSVGGGRFEFRGVTYGTFAPRADGVLFPERDQLERDLAMMRAAGFSVVRTYTVPPDDLLEVASGNGLRVLAGVFYPDWRYLLGGSRRANRRVAREARREVRAAARRFAGNHRILGLSLGNEVPADVLRWHGLETVTNTLNELVEVVREEDPSRLVTYANYPTAEYLPLEGIDFLMFNVFLERREDFRRYLTKLHHLAGDRPLVLGEMGIPAGDEEDGEHQQAEVLDWQIQTAIERGVAGTCVFQWTDEWWVGGAPVTGWGFGLTREDRSRRPALQVASRWNERTVRDLDFNWPSISVVICAHNAASTLDECLRHTCALDYPELEVLVVDDGSTDATPEIARRHPGVRLLQIDHGGLAAARNAGFEAAAGELVAYLDSDAFPTPEWPYYLALAFDGPDVGGAGGPNIPPSDEPPGAEVVARAPGGPVQVLFSDDRAEHIPGCNMAFWKLVLSEIGGFDPVYTKAGDDVDACWKILNRDWKIGFHPAALVWHRRRQGLRNYLRQQLEYGRSEALVEDRHPERFTPAGTARWRGRIYNSLTPSFMWQRIYRGPYGTAAYQSVYQGGGHVVDLVHQVGIPIAAMLLLTIPLALISPWLALPAAFAALALSLLAAVDMVRIPPPRRSRTGGIRFRAQVAAHHLLQPLVRFWGRNRHRNGASRELGGHQMLPEGVRRVRGGIVVVPEDRPRSELAAALVSALRARGIRALPSSGWEDYDARLLLAMFAYGELQTSSHPEGFVQIRIRTRPRLRRLTGAVAMTIAAAWVVPLLGALVLLPTLSLLKGAVDARRLPASLLAATETP
jgi:cellulose synthase/poly-beta-1,6-N-acetylglucosamine synthase-like glycosyltransferase